MNMRFESIHRVLAKEFLSIIKKSESKIKGQEKEYGEDGVLAFWGR
jgi:hypothetical protein